MLFRCLIFFLISCDFSIPNENELYERDRLNRLFKSNNYSIVAYRYSQGQTSGFRTRVPNELFTLKDGILSFEIRSGFDSHVEYDVEITLIPSVYTKDNTQFLSNYIFEIKNTDTLLNKQTEAFEQNGYFGFKEIGRENFFNIEFERDVNNWLKTNSYYQFKWFFQVASGNNSAGFSGNTAAYTIDLNIYSKK